MRDVFAGIIIGIIVIFAVLLFIKMNAREDETALASPAKVPAKYQPQEPMPGAWRSVVMNVSAYCPCKKCCGPFDDGVTASKMPVDGPVTHWIAAPKEYSFGTVMIVPGYHSGPVVVLDRGGDIKGNKLDCFFPTHALARAFGRQEITVQIWEQEK